MLKKINNNPKEIWEDVWIHTCCGGCYSACGVKVHRVNGIPLAIEGEPGSTLGAEGGICAKGVAMLALVHDPNRRNVPLRRTNPKKGLYEEGKFVEITWDEALDEITKRLKKIMGEDSRKLAFVDSPSPNATMKHNFIATFFAAFGQPTRINGGAATHCGNAAHHVTGQYYASWDAGADWKYCNYAIFFGASQGFGSGHASTTNIRLAAAARERGMKFVVFDPMCNNTGDKATEWIPIIPGTDSAVVLAMINVIINELGIYDSKHIKYKSNGPYLIGPDGLYVRDTKTKKPMIWDPVDNKAKIFNDKTIKDFALFGEYEVKGITCHPSFELIKEHVKQYTPEFAEGVSTVPVNTIRRIATEFANAAQIGSTITIDGVKLPYRPVSAAIFRGGQGHANGMHQVYSVHILNCILGAMDVPGGTVALCPSRVLGDPGTGRPRVEPFADPDGFLTPALWSDIVSHTAESWQPHRQPMMPKTQGLTELFNQAISSPLSTSKDRHELWQKLGIDYQPEMLLSLGSNSVMGQGNPETHAEALLEIPFIVTYDLYPTEMSEGFADIVLPDCSKLEHTASCADAYEFYFNQPFAYEDFSIHVTQPVIEPQYKRRFMINVLLELTDRLGIRDKYNSNINLKFDLDKQHSIKKGEKLNLEQISDRVFKNNHGEDHGIDWFKEHGFIRWKKKPEEAYWRWFLDVRVPMYLENLVHDGAKIKQIAEKAGVHANWDQYTGLVSWFPNPVHKVGDSEYDLYCYSYRSTLHTGGQTHENIWLDEASRMNPWLYSIVINTDTAKKKGLKEGDIIVIESNYGRKTKGPVKLTETVHPRCVGIATTAGHWVKGQPIAYGKGVYFNELLELDLEHSDPVSLSLETSAKVKIYKA
ncbi:MAG: molybdopterin-dependent oxidoreductase [Chloroflexi bacterium]|nr:molybdopterin-dependent oxidoreductase [Chloroflexota bacterium]